MGRKLLKICITELWSWFSPRCFLQREFYLNIMYLCFYFIALNIVGFDLSLRFVFRNRIDTSFYKIKKIRALRLHFGCIGEIRSPNNVDFIVESYLWDLWLLIFMKFSFYYFIGGLKFRNTVLVCLSNLNYKNAV
jgi:hypothetical protein